MSTLKDALSILFVTLLMAHTLPTGAAQETGTSSSLSSSSLSSSSVSSDSTPERCRAMKNRQRATCMLEELRQRVKKSDRPLRIRKSDSTSLSSASNADSNLRLRTKNASGVADVVHERIVRCKELRGTLKAACLHSGITDMLQLMKQKREERRSARMAIRDACRHLKGGERIRCIRERRDAWNAGDSSASSQASSIPSTVSSSSLAVSSSSANATDASSVSSTETSASSVSSQ